mgnify:CR=1 FL=1
MENQEFILHPSKSTEREEIVQLLRRNFENPPDYWNWKYIKNPTIDSSLILVIKKKQKIVGCGCWLHRTLKISGQLEISSLQTAHLAIDREFQKSGLGKRLLLSMQNASSFNKKGAAICLAVILDNYLYKNFYRRISRHIPISESTAVYAKFLACDQLKKQLEKMNKVILSKPELASSLSKMNLSIRCVLKGAPSFVIQTSANGLEMKEINSTFIGENASFTIRGDFMFVKELIEGYYGISSLFFQLLRNKIALIGNPFSLPKLYRLYKIAKSAYYN